MRPTTIEVVRSLGQTASRLADWQVDTMARVLSESEAPVDLAAVGEGMAVVMPGLESLLVHAWRRHLAAAIGRGLAFVADDPDAVSEPTLATVGFADIAGFTRLARVMADEDLAQMVQAFESGRRRHRGRARRAAGQDPGRRGHVRLRQCRRRGGRSPRRCIG